MPSTDDLWSMYGRQILRFAVPDFDPTKQQFSLASSTLSLDLGNPDPAVVNSHTYALGNTIPGPGPSYQPGGALLDSYRRFLDAMDLHDGLDPKDYAEISIASDAINAAQTNFQDAQSAAFNAYPAYQVMHPDRAFYDYVAEQCPTYIQALKDIDVATRAWQSLMIRKHGLSYEIIANLRNLLSPDRGAADILKQTAYNMQVKTDAASLAAWAQALPGATLQPADDLISSFSPSFFLDGFGSAYRHWQGDSVAGARPAASIVVEGGAAGGDVSDMGWSRDSAAWFSNGFFEVVGDASSPSDTRPPLAMDPGVHMRIDFTGLGAFAIQTGAWFAPGVVKLYRNQLLPNAPDLFSPNGALARVPCKAIIGFQPRITLSMSQEAFAAFQSTFQSPTTAAVGFGPFVVGETDAPSYADKSHAAFDAQSATVTVSPPPGAVPVLLGVVSTRFDI